MNNNRIYRLTIGLIFTYTILVVVSIIFHRYIPLANDYIWNIFLALLPLLCALLIDFLFYKKENQFFSLLIGIIWLILFPNSPYMVTDLAHLNLYHVSYGLDISTFHSAWFGVLFATFSIITGVLMGMLSFYLVSQIIRKKFGTITAWIFSMIVSLLSGFGVFLGRFPRFNSWDIIRRPDYLFKIALDQINSHTLGFVVLFSTMTFALYWLFYLIFDVSAKSDKI